MGIREEQGDAENKIGSDSLRSAGLTPGGLGSDMDTLSGDDVGDADTEGDLGDDAGGEAGADTGDTGGEGDISI